MKTEDYAIALWESLADYLNEQVANKTLRIDDHYLWNTYFHSFSDSDWLLLIGVIERIQDKHPHYIKGFQISALEQVREEILTHHRTTPRVMDKRDRNWDNKKLSWKAAMCLREIWCQIHGLDLNQEIKTRAFRKTERWNS